MISVPRNPIQMAAIRRALMTSPRNSTAPIVTNNGVVKLSDHLRQRDHIEAVNPQNMPTELTAARRKTALAGACEARQTQRAPAVEVK